MEEEQQPIETFWDLEVEKGEQRGEIKNQISNIQELLTMSYGSDADALCEQVSKIADMKVLRKVFRLVYRTDSLEETTRKIDVLLGADPHAADPLKFD